MREWNEAEKADFKWPYAITPKIDINQNLQDTDKRFEEFNFIQNSLLNQ